MSNPSLKYKFLNKFIQVIKDNKILFEKDKVVAAVSGGPDSMALLYALYLSKDLLKIDILVAHLNHMIRGDMAIKDAEFVRMHSGLLNLPIITAQRDVIKFKNEKKLSLEEAARVVRYDFLKGVCLSSKFNKIAVGHNKEDQAETLLLRLLRGAGLSGMSGMAHKTDEGIIRPFLDFERKEIVAFLKAISVAYRTDHTNTDSKYMRNRVRNDLTPLLRERFNNRVTEALYRQSLIFRDDENYLHKKTCEYIEDIVIKDADGTYVINTSHFSSIDIAIKKRIIREVVRLAAGSIRGLEFKHINKVMDLVENDIGGKEITLPNNIVCYYLSKRLYLFIKRKGIEDDFKIALQIPGNTSIDHLSLKITSTIYSCPVAGGIDHASDNMILLDYDKISTPLFLRNKKSGDIFMPYGMMGRKKIKDIFIDMKVPRIKRNLIPVLIGGREILWILGKRRSRHALVGKDTQKILKVTITPV